MDGPMNTTLKTSKQVQRLLETIGLTSLTPHPDPERNWDAWLTYSAFRHYVPLPASVLIMGHVHDGPLAAWLAQAGYCDLHGCDRDIPPQPPRYPIKLVIGDPTALPYAAHTFDVVSCLGVLKNGCNLHAIFGELRRVLKPGGVAAVSFDYWYIVDDNQPHVFTTIGANEVCAVAQQYGLHLTGNLDTQCQEPVFGGQEGVSGFTQICLALRQDDVACLAV